MEQHKIKGAAASNGPPLPRLLTRRHVAALGAAALLSSQRAAAQAGAPISGIVLTRLSGANATNDALLSGSVDIGAYGLPGMLILAEKSRRSLGARGLASLSTSSYSLFSSNPAIKSVRDFTDVDRIAVTAPNTPQGLLLQMAAEQAFGAGQAKRLDTLMVSLPHPDATAAMMSSGGGVTAYFAPEPFSSTMAANPRLHVVTTSENILGMPLTGGLLATSARFVQSRGPAAAAIVAALRDTNRLLKADPRRGYEVYVANEPSRLPPEQLVQVIGATTWDTAPTGVMAYASFMQRTGLLKAAPATWRDVFFPPVSEGEGS